MKNFNNDELIKLSGEFKEFANSFDLIFRKKLKEILKYRGFNQKYFGIICGKKQYSISKYLSTDPKLKTTPNFPDVVAMSKILKCNLLYFIVPEMTCIEADLSEENNSIFIETSVTKELYSTLEIIKNNKSIGIILTPNKNGTSFALNQFCNNQKNILYVKVEDFYNASARFKSTINLVIIEEENSSRIFNFVKNLNNFNYPALAIVLKNDISSDLMGILSNNTRISIYNIDALNTTDIFVIIKKLAPFLDEKVINFIKNKSMGNIKTLFSIIQLVLNNKQEKVDLLKLISNNF